MPSLICRAQIADVTFCHPQGPGKMPGMATHASKNPGIRRNIVSQSKMGASVLIGSSFCGAHWIERLPGLDKVVKNAVCASVPALSRNQR